MTIGTFDNPFSETQTRRPVTHCRRCGADIHLEDDCYLFYAEILCKQCGENDPTGRLLSGQMLEDFFKELYGGL